MLNSTWKFLRNVPSDRLHLKLLLVRSPGESWACSRLRNAPGEGDEGALMVGLGALGRVFKDPALLQKGSWGSG